MKVHSGRLKGALQHLPHWRYSAKRGGLIRRGLNFSTLPLPPACDITIVGGERVRKLREHWAPAPAVCRDVMDARIPILNGRRATW
jgi:hypothetical protein